jgi:hypothetical protein
MPKNTVNQAAAAKAKKQKIVLIVGGVVLLALGALQGPKLLKHGGSEAAPPPASVGNSDGGTTGASQAVSQPSAAVVTPAITPAVVASGKTVGVVAGVPLTAAASVKPATNQLVSFTLFEAKDPFVPGEDGSVTPTDQAAGVQGATPPAGTDGQPPAAPSSPATGQPAAAPPVKTAPEPIVYATIDFDGKPQQLKVKDDFPADQPLFVLRSVKKKSAKIAVAGGSFDDSETFTLKLNKKVTLVNTATGVRYEIKLVYTGAAPEVIEGFSTTPGTTDTTTTTDTASTANAG